MINKRQQIRLNVTYFSAFLLLGMTTAVLGPSLLELAEQTGSSLKTVSAFFPIRSLAYLAGSWLSGLLYDRVPGHRLILISLLSIAGSIALVPAVPTLGVMVAALLVLGLGMGFLDVGCNTLLMWAYGTEAAPLLNALHFFYGLGSFAAPVILAQAFRMDRGIGLGYWVMAGLCLPVIFSLFRLPSPKPAPDQAPLGEGDQQAVGNTVGEMIGSVSLLALFLFVYVGVEVGFGGWIYTYGLQSGLESEATAAYLTSAFWGAFTAGRLFGIPVATRFRPRRVLAVDITGAVLALGLILLWPESRGAAWIGTIALGLFIASVFPTTLALIEGQLHLTGKITSWFFISAGLGGVFLPWLIGRLAVELSPLAIPRTLFWSSLIAAGLLVVYLLRTFRSVSV